jgi:hypothetical protein
LGQKRREKDEKRFVVLSSLSRMSIDPTEGAPPGWSGRATLRLIPGGAVVYQVEATVAQRGDSLATRPGTHASTVAAFADCFLARDTAGTVGFETLSVFNPSASATSVRIQYLFSDGSVIEETTTLEAGATLRRDLHANPDLVQHAELNFFSTLVYSDVSTLSSLVQWDLFQGGGWETLGTPLGEVMRL